MLCVESFVPMFRHFLRNIGKGREALHTVIITEFIQFIHNAASKNCATLLLKLLHCGHYLSIILCCARRRLSSEWKCTWMEAGTHQSLFRFHQAQRLHRERLHEMHFLAHNALKCEIWFFNVLSSMFAVFPSLEDAFSSSLKIANEAAHKFLNSISRLSHSQSTIFRRSRQMRSLNGHTTDWGRSIK